MSNPKLRTCGISKKIVKLILLISILTDEKVIDFKSFILVK